MSLLMIIVTALLGSAIYLGQFASSLAETEGKPQLPLPKISLHKLADRMPATTILNKDPQAIQEFVRAQSQPKSPDFGEIKKVLDHFVSELKQ